MKPLLVILTLFAFAVLMVVSPVAWFRMVRAKTRDAYWKSIVLFVAPILLTFLFANGAGLIPESPVSTPTPPSAERLFGQMPAGQLIALGATALLWIGGGNLLIHTHNRRLGKKWWQGLNPFDPPFKDFNTREWIILGVLLAGSMALGIFSVSLGHAK